MTRYKITGTQPVLDQQPGHIFEADIPSELEAYLFAIGAIKVLDKAFGKTEKPKVLDAPLSLPEKPRSADR